MFSMYIFSLHVVDCKRIFKLNKRLFQLHTNVRYFDTWIMCFTMLNESYNMKMPLIVNLTNVKSIHQPLPIARRIWTWRNGPGGSDSLWCMEERCPTLFTFKYFLSHNCLFTLHCYWAIEDEGRVILVSSIFVGILLLNSVIEILLRLNFWILCWLVLGLCHKGILFCPYQIVCKEK